MDVSSTSNSSLQETANKAQSSQDTQDLIKTAQDFQEQQNLKILESTTEQSQQMTAQKTGMGNNINITG